MVFSVGIELYVSNAWFTKNGFTKLFLEEFSVGGWVKVRVLGHPNTHEYEVELPNGKLTTITSFHLKNAPVEQPTGGIRQEAPKNP